jgi:hypothetical protein
MAANPATLDNNDSFIEFLRGPKTPHSMWSPDPDLKEMAYSFAFQAQTDFGPKIEMLRQ